MSVDTPYAPGPSMTPSLTHAVPPSPQGVVLMLHGGADRGLGPVDDRSLSWQRSSRMMRSISAGLHADDLAVALLRYRVKGWNASPGSPPSPVPDARWALAQIRDEHPGLPIALVGHSMGGRTAVAVACEPGVVGVVALAPWLPEGEPVDAVAGSVLHIAHGRADKITSPRASARYALRARAAGAQVTYTDMGRVGHYMFRGAARWNAFALERSRGLLLAAARG